jgi:hypothetical protein
LTTAAEAVPARVLAGDAAMDLELLVKIEGEAKARGSSAQPQDRRQARPDLRPAIAWRARSTSGSHRTTASMQFKVSRFARPAALSGP